MMQDALQAYTVQDSQLAAKWAAFFEQPDREDLSDPSPFQRVRQAALDYPEVRCIVIGFDEIQLRDPDLADYILLRPRHAHRVGTSTVYQVDVTVEPKPRLGLRITGLPEGARVPIRGLRAEHLNRFVAVEGLVKKLTQVRSIPVEAAFECKACGNLVHVFQDEDRLQQPVQCDNCERTTNWRHKQEQSRCIDYQKVEIQEVHDGLPGCAQPERLTVHLREDLVHSVGLGDRVRFNGVLVLEARRHGNAVEAAFTNVLEAVSVEHQQRTFEDIQVTKEDEAAIKELARDPAIYDRLRASFAPTIYGLGMEKDALILTLFGGVAKHHADGSRNRGDIHVLMVGDPGVAKSQIIRYLSKLAPRGIFTSGKSSSAAGLTAAAVKDGFDGQQWTLEAGALVLADQGIAVIDELDKMSSQDRSSMHQAMEQQEVSIAKAGIHATYPSRCAVVAAANPKLGRFDQYEPIHAQIDLPPALLSRFDLIFSLLDRPTRAHDEALADHVLSGQEAGQVREHRRANPAGAYSLDDEHALTRSVEPDLAAELVRKYVAYAKRHVFPVLTPEARARIKQHYVDLRNAGDSSLPFTARQLEAFVRLAEASARIRLSQHITVEDAERAIRMVDYYLQSVGVDHETGKVDIDIIATGVSRSEHDRVRVIQGTIERLSKAAGKNYADEDEVLAELLKAGIAEDVVRKDMNRMRRNGSLWSPNGNGTVGILRRLA